MCPHVVSTCFFACVHMFLCMCPHVVTHVSTCFCACVLDRTIMCPYVFIHMYSCCSKCRWRKGRSAFRKGSRQSARKINSLYDIYTLNEGVPKQLAARKLRRWGFHPDRRCALPLVCDQLLIRCPGHEDDLFPAVDFREE